MPPRTLGLKNGDMVNDGAVDSVVVLEDQRSLVDMCLDKAEVGVVKVLGYVEDGAGSDGVVRAEISSSTVGQMGDGVASGNVSVVINLGVGIDPAVSTERSHALVEVDMPGQVGVDLSVKEDGLEGGADVVLPLSGAGAVEGTVADDNDPRGDGPVDSSEVLCHPLDLLVGLGVVDVTVDCAEGTRVLGAGVLGLDMVVVLALEVGGKGGLGRVGVVSLGVQHDEMDEAVVPRVPEVANAAGHVAGHGVAVLVGSEVTLGWRAAVVVELLGRGGGVELVMVEIVSSKVVGVVGHAARLVVTRGNHVGDLCGDAVHPLLPDIPVGLVEGSGIAATRGASGGLLVLGEGLEEVGLDGTFARGSAVGAGVADTVGTALAGEEAVVPVVGIGHVTAMSEEVNLAVFNALHHEIVRLAGVGIAHVVQDTEDERGLVASGVSRLERHDFGGCGAVGRLDLVEIGGRGLEAIDSDVVEELIARSNRADLRARGDTAIAMERKPITVSFQPVA